MRSLEARAETHCYLDLEHTILQKDRPPMRQSVAKLQILPDNCKHNHRTGEQTKSDGNQHSRTRQKMTKSKLRRVKPDSSSSSRSDNDERSNSRNNPQNVEFGVHGVRLKHFEQVMANILPTVAPNYVCLPPIPVSSSSSRDSNADDDKPESEWPFNISSNGTSSRASSSYFPIKLARVWGDLPGQLSNYKRAMRKESQIRSMLRCIFPLVPLIRRHRHRRPPTIVDFGGGSGHLSIPLALLFPDCLVIVVDLNERSLNLLHEKTKAVQEALSQEKPQQEQQHYKETSTTERDECKSSSPSHSLLEDAKISENMRSDARFRRCLTNLYSFYGPVEDFDEPFEMALALHLCGEATDVGLRKAAMKGATAMVVAPCCVGKLSKRALNPDVYHATGSNVATVSYPQSEIFCRLIGTRNEKTDTTQQAEEDWNALAKAADYSNEGEVRTSRNATRRTAKALLEKDRQLFLETMYGYRTALTRMEPLEATPKNDILIAWKTTPSMTDKMEDNNSCDDDLHLFQLFGRPDDASQSDIHVAKSHLLLCTNTKNIDDSTNLGNGAAALRKDLTQNVTPRSSNDWTQEEEMAVQKAIDKFLETTKDMDDALNQVLIFPTRMGGRKRKLIHFVAGQKGLAHWSVGYKDRDKTVAVARRGQRHRNPLATNADK